eukprot:10972256-Lingulodinium_polyedra.AAC.1
MPTTDTLGLDTARRIGSRFFKLIARNACSAGQCARNARGCKDTCRASDRLRQAKLRTRLHRQLKRAS